MNLRSGSIIRGLPDDGRLPEDAAAAASRMITTQEARIRRYVGGSCLACSAAYTLLCGTDAIAALPSFGAATGVCLIANGQLSLAVAFPIVTSGPGIVSALWGVLVFGEIRGGRNYSFLVLAVVLAVVGCILIALSKPP